MKKVAASGIFVLGFAVYLMTSSFSGGTFGTTLPATAGCFCHGPMANTAVSISVAGSPTHFIPGQTYNVTITVANPAKAGAGFELVALDAGGNIAGTFTAPTGTQINTVGSISHLGTQVGLPATWVVSWTAPATSAGDINFQAAGNAVDLMGSTANDEWSFGSTVPLPLPITLGQFTSEVTSQNDIQLFWQTESEENGSHFNIERSLDGRNFETIETITVQGGDLQGYAYDYLDLNPPKDLSLYYRLDMIDLDGSQSYSPIISEKIKLSEVATQLIPSTIQSGGSVTLQGLNLTSENNEVRLYDMMGQMVSSQQIDQSNPSIQIPNLAVGRYLVAYSDFSEPLNLFVQ